MAILPIVQYPDSRLSRVCEPVVEFNEELKTLAENMADTMYDAPGVGLAAPQIGRCIRLVVVDISEEKNQLSALTEESTTCEEGCLSLPGIYEKVERPARVLVKAQNLDGTPCEMECEGLMAVCIQHEVDHLNGKVFVDHLSQLKKSRATAKLAKRRKEEARNAKKQG